MINRILTSALIAGAAAGLIAAVLQLVFVQPVLLHAELYETGALTHFGAGTPPSAAFEFPGFDPMRDGLSIVFTMLVYTGYSLILTALMSIGETRGLPVNARSGLIWGLCGFIAVHFAPGFSLPPEVPGVAAADVAARQIWWLATVLATSAALALIVIGRGWGAWTIVIVLLIAPHVIGAPEPESFSGPVPPEIGALFAARAYGVGMAAWVALGALAGYFWSRAPDSLTKPATT